MQTRRLDAIPDFLAHSALSEADRQALGPIHPSFIGGEYLPNLSQNEVMIASITIASITRDVTSVYARRSKKRIYYRVVDEYGGETLSRRNTRTSAQPLTLGQLEKFHVLASHDQPGTPQSRAPPRPRSSGWSPLLQKPGGTDRATRC